MLNSTVHKLLIVPKYLERTKFFYTERNLASFSVLLIHMKMPRHFNIQEHDKFHVNGDEHEKSFRTLVQLCSNQKDTRVEYLMRGCWNIFLVLFSNTEILKINIKIAGFLTLQISKKHQDYIIY